VKNALLITKGHPFEREPFFSMFDALPQVQTTHVEQPAAQALFSWEHAQQYDAFVHYDMPGIDFTAPDGPTFAEPSAAFKSGFLDLLNRGVGFVFLHHAIAAWPAWPEYAEIVGGRFCYVPMQMRGQAVQDSGYRHGVDHQVRVVSDHPVTQGVPESFAITDELYLYEVNSADVTPLLRSDYRFNAENFYSAAAVVRDGKMFHNDGWQHAPGSDLIGWAKIYRNSRIVYLQCGDDHQAYANPHFQQLLGNAIAWVSAPAGRSKNQS